MTQPQAHTYNFFLSLSQVVDPYVKVFLEGPFLDEKSNKPFTTHVVQDNGFHPVRRNNRHKDNVAVVEALVPEMTTLVVQVFDHDTVGFDIFLAECFVPLHLLRTGFRCFPLTNIKSQPLHASFILAHIKSFSM